MKLHFVLIRLVYFGSQLVRYLREVFKIKCDPFWQCVYLSFQVIPGPAHQPTTGKHPQGQRMTTGNTHMAQEEGHNITRQLGLERW